MNVVRVKDGVQFTKIAPAGFTILAALSYAATTLGCDLTITSACDGEHSGPDDPHHTGEAYDIRTHGLAVDKKIVLNTIWEALGKKYFFGWIENENEDNEHIHFQRAKETIYPSLPVADLSAQGDV